MNFDFAPAEAFELDALTALWNRAYEGYLVALTFSPQMLARHIERAQVDLYLSRVLLVDGEPAGVSLAATDGVRAYLAGFGIVLPRRRGGWGQRLLAEQLLALQADGRQAVQLEVIETNPARQLYAQAGFVEEHALLVLQGRLDRLPEGGALRPAPAHELAGLHARLHRAAPTWRREWRRLATLGSPPGIQGFVLGEEAFAIVSEGPELLGLVDAAARDDAAAHALLCGLEAHYPGRTWRLVDEPEHTPLARVAGEAGLDLLLRQVQMRAPLPA